MGIMDKVYSREWIQKFQNVQTEQEIDDFVEQYKMFIFLFFCIN